MKLTLSSGAAVLLDALHAAGYAAYAVGGCVRDGLLGFAPTTGTCAPAPCRSK
jgi:tRNA nucleotidyltransferase (CCA-adding enzyme)